jgi:hypothetical protein
MKIESGTFFTNRGKNMYVGSNATVDWTQKNIENNNNEPLYPVWFSKTQSSVNDIILIDELPSFRQQIYNYFVPSDQDYNYCIYLKTGSYSIRCGSRQKNITVTANMSTNIY